MSKCLRSALGLSALVVWCAFACGSADHPPPYQRRPIPVDAGDAGDAGASLPIDGYGAGVAPPEDVSGLCGNQILRPVQTRPNLYLVLDRSGSMQDPMKDALTNRWIEKWLAARRAVYDVLFGLGHRLAYGAAVFPRFGVVDTCEPGAEIDRTSDGDSVTYARSGVVGPHLAKLQKSLDSFVPEGSTPTSTTLERLVDPLIALGGNTTVILATDGAPNCNVNAVCDIAHCTANLESAPLPNGSYCSSNVNCCDASAYWGPVFCIDVDATLVPIAKLLQHGIKTYVVGLPGSELYADVLNRMAIAGGTARGNEVSAGGLTGNAAVGAAGATSNAVGAADVAGATTSAASGGEGAGSAGAAISAVNAATPSAGGAESGHGIAGGALYYPVTDTEQLKVALRGITAALSISCTIALDASPPDWSKVNVYFDNHIVKMDPNEGWTRRDANTIEITGTTCDLLRSGDVFQVQIVAGCPTETLF